MNEHQLNELEQRLRELEKQVAFLLQVNSKSDTNDNTDTAITNTFHDLGIPSNLIGYKYLKTIVKLFVEGKVSDSLNSQELYSKVAELHRKTVTGIDHAICHAIEVGYDRGDLEFWKKLFGYPILNSKPTNSQFIATIVEYIEYIVAM